LQNTKAWWEKCDVRTDRQRGITNKILMPELWILCMTLDPLKLYPHMKFHFNSISWTWGIAKYKSVTGKVWRTDRQRDRWTIGQMDGQTDGQTDNGEVIPKCHLFLQQLTQKTVVISREWYSLWHKTTFKQNKYSQLSISWIFYMFKIPEVQINLHFG